MKKRMVLGILCLCLVTGFVPGAWADESGAGGNQTTAPTEELPIPTAPAAPTAQEITCQQIVLKPAEGCEYALIEQGNSVTTPVVWQTTPVFADIKADTTYTVYQRYAATAEHQASPSSVGLAVIPKHSERISVKDPTCTEKGYTQHVCTVCGASYTDSETAALGHSYENTVIAPTCTTKGYTKHTCTRCGDSYTDAETAMVNHTYKDTVVAPTCTAKGYTKHVCTVCGASYTDSETAALGHSYKNTVVAPTCTTKGYTKHTCTRCGDSYTDSEKAALGHSYKNTVVAPTCTAKGYTKHTCTRCKYSYTDTAKAALGHKLKKTAAKKATCTASGHKEYWTCTRCKKVYSDSKGKNATTVAKRTVKATGHSYQTTTTKATPSKNGSIKNACKNCGKKKSSTVISRPKRIVLSKTSYAWDGDSHKPTVKVKNANGKTVSSKNYTVTYPSNTTSTGKHTITVTFKGKKYSGKMTASYTISAKSISSKKIHLSRNFYTYNGKAHQPAVTISGLRQGTDYTVSYSNNVNAGIASVKVTGKGGYTGSVSKTFTVRPKKTSIKKLSARKEGFYVRWKAIPSQISGYEVEYARKSGFAKSKKVYQVAEKRSIKVLDLKGEKNYYVRVRTYKNVGNTRVYSKWSVVWQVQTKAGASE